MVVVDCCAFVFSVAGIYYVYGDEERVCWNGGGRSEEPAVAGGESKRQKKLEKRGGQKMQYR